MMKKQILLLSLSFGLMNAILAQEAENPKMKHILRNQHQAHQSKKGPLWRNVNKSQEINAINDAIKENRNFVLKCFNHVKHKQNQDEQTDATDQNKQKEMHRLQWFDRLIARHYAKNNVAFYFINQDSKNQDVQNFLKTHNVMLEEGHSVYMFFQNGQEIQRQADITDGNSLIAILKEIYTDVETLTPDQINPIQQAQPMRVERPRQESMGEKQQYRGMQKPNFRHGGYRKSDGTIQDYGTPADFDRSTTSTDNMAT